VSSPADVAQLLAEELASLRSFIKILNEEQASLIAGRIDELSTLAERKSSLAKNLARISESRESALKTEGREPNRNGMDVWADSVGNPTWAELLKLAAEARTLNQINGTLIAERLRSNQKALQALTAAGERAALYGPDGQTTVLSGAGRSIGSA